MEQKTAIRKLSFTVTCTEKEYRSAYYTVQWCVGVWRWLPLFIAGAIGLLILLAVLQVRGPLTAAPVTALVLLLAAILFYVLYGICYIEKRIQHYWHAYREFGISKQVHVHQTGLVVSTGEFRLQMSFAECRRVVEKPTFYLLIQDRRRFVLIPKRDIPLQDSRILLKYIRHGLKKRSIYD